MPAIMDVLDAIRNRRSHRAFLDRPVEREKIETILDAAHWAPSPANSQPWEFVVVTGKLARRRLYELSEEAKRSGRIEVRGFSYVRPMPAELETPEDAAKSVRNYPLGFLAKVPVIFGIVGLPLASIRQASFQETHDAYKYSCGAVIQNMLLTCEALGLGSLWFTFFDPELAPRYLQVDRSKHLVAMVLAGYPAAAPKPPGRQPLQTKVRWIE
ncbi:MAG: nitroreductase family protein [Thermoleophilia bacterium]